MDIEFKEKTFEKYFGHELARLTNVTYSPDQCDEEMLGFDEAFFMPSDWLFRFGPYVRRRRREKLSGISIKNFNERGRLISSHMPKFKFNLFVQFKRPKFLISSGASEWSHWKQSYYRYEITPHQQEALERLDEESHGRAATLYASPAFWRADALYEHVKANAVVEQSNFVSAAKLKGHGRYTYVSPGCFGKGHSEPVDISGQTLRDILKVGFESNDELPLNQHLKKAALSIVAAANGSDTITPVFQRVQSALGFEGLNPDSLYDAITIIEVFSEVFGVRHYALA